MIDALFSALILAVVALALLVAAVAVVTAISTTPSTLKWWRRKGVREWGPGGRPASRIKDYPDRSASRCQRLLGRVLSEVEESRPGIAGGDRNGVGGVMRKWWKRKGVKIEHWSKLPIALRRRFWRETDYNTNKPSPELLAEIEAWRREHPPIDDSKIKEIEGTAADQHAKRADIDDDAARLPALARLERDIEYRLPNGKPLGHIVLSRDQGIELLALLRRER